MRYQKIIMLAGLVLGVMMPLLPTIHGQRPVLAQPTHPPNAKAERLLQQGSQQYRRRQFHAALPAWEKALTIYQAIGDRQREALSLNYLGLAYQSLGQYQQAMECYQHALVIFRRISDAAGEGRILSHLGDVFEALGETEFAITLLKQSINIRERLPSGLLAISDDRLASEVPSLADDYRQLAHLLLSQSRVLEAHAILEQHKIQELQDYTQETLVDDHASEGSPLTSAEAAITPHHDSLIALGRHLTQCENQRPVCPERDQLRQQRDAANATFNHHMGQLKSIARQQRGNDPAQLETNELKVAAQKIVQHQPGTILIYPFVLDDKLWLLWVSQAGKRDFIFERKEVAVSAEQLYQTVHQFRQLLSTPDPSNLTQLQQVGQQLHQWLIEPLQDELETNDIKNLVFSHDRSTRYIPLAALFDGEKYLIEKYAISTILTSGLTDTQDQLSANHHENSVLALGLSQPVSNFSALPSVAQEIDAIVRDGPQDSQGIYPGLSLMDEQFTKDALSKHLIDHRILHLATHGKFFPGHPNDSYLVLGDGNTLPIPEIKSLPDLSGIHLVVLSACETALGGPDADGLEVAGMSYYFLAGTAKSVMASLWPVNDASTSQLIEQFYRNLASGQLSKSEALRQAQLAMIDAETSIKAARHDSVIKPVPPAPPSGMALSHPNYWAPFILIGNGR